MTTIDRPTICIDALKQVVEDLTKANEKLLKLAVKNLFDFAKYDAIHLEIDKAIQCLEKLKTKIEQ